MELDAGTFLLQLAAGGLLFCWVTTRRREVGIGYGWLLRGVYGVLALGGALVLLGDDHVLAATLAFATIAATALALGVSIARRGAGVRGQAELRAERKARVGAMVGRGDEAVLALLYELASGAGRPADDGGAPDCDPGTGTT